MTEFTPTAEQLAIIEAATETDDNLIISALAGAAKTTTLVLIAEALAGREMLCLAFNKRIAEEMNARLPRNCTAKTLNGLGHKAWSDTLGRFCKLNTSKNFEIMKEIIEKELSADDRREVYESFGELLRMVAEGKSSGYIPDGHFPNGRALLNDDEFRNSLDENITDLQWWLVKETSARSMALAWKGQIDFDDQLLMPTVFQAIFPRYPVVMIDEAQDLSALNHAMLRKIARKRLIAVGDECQAIYGFRGAHANSMAELQKTFEMRKLILSISFRCPKRVVEHAQWRAPHMKYPEWAKTGEVTHLKEWSVDDLPETGAIICRNNAPIFNIAIKLLKNGRYPQIIGADIGKQLIKIMKRFGSENMSQAAAQEALASWVEMKKAKSKDPAKIDDQAECISIFLDQGATLGDAIAYAEHILSTRGPIQLMTGHKSKGLEFEDVFILDRNLVRTDKAEQERNLLYVMQTRAKNSLTYIETEGFIDAT